MYSWTVTFPKLAAVPSTAIFNNHARWLAVIIWLEIRDAANVSPALKALDWKCWLRQTLRAHMKRQVLRSCVMFAGFEESDVRPPPRITEERGFAAAVLSSKLQVSVDLWQSLEHYDYWMMSLQSRGIPYFPGGPVSLLLQHHKRDVCLDFPISDPSHVWI